MRIAAMQSYTSQPDISQMEIAVYLAKREVACLLDELEPTLTPRQVSLLHQIRLAAESLGASRAVLLSTTPR
jgi:hypothetical protein